MTTSDVSPAAPTPPPDLSTVSVNGATFHYRSAGTGEPLILVHANISDLRSWDPIFPLLTPHFYVIAYSRRYFWPNTPIPDKTPDPWEDHAEDLAELISVLELKAPVNIMGNSSGAFICLLLAQKHPDLVKTLILEEPPVVTLFLPNFPPTFYDILNLLWSHPLSFFPFMYFGAMVIGPAESAFKRGDNEAALHAFCRGIVDTGTYQNLTSARLDQMRDNILTHRALLCYGKIPVLLEKDVRAIKTRALVFSGPKTGMSQRQINERLAAVLPDGKLVEVKGAAHLIHEDRPEEVVAAVRGFLGI